MRFLADESFPRAAVDALRGAGHDVAWVRTDGPGATDGRFSVVEPERVRMRALLG